MLIIDSNQFQDYTHNTDSHKMKTHDPHHDCTIDTDSHKTKTHDPHDAAHNMDTKSHMKHESPNKTRKAPQEARRRAAARRIRTKREDNIKWSQLSENVPEVLIELRGSRELLRGRRWGRRAKPATRRTQTSVLQVTAFAPLVPAFSYEGEGNFKGSAPDCVETRAA